MPFKIAARTILQLGGELISSDGIAFYELVKNAFDARSKRVTIDVDISIPGHSYRHLTAFLEDKSRKRVSDSELDSFRTEVISHLDNAAPRATEVLVF